MTEPVQCHACGATHDASDLFCPRCGTTSSTAPTIPSGGAPTPKPAPSDAVLRELQEALAPQIQVIRELGAGGMGTVYLGRDPALKRLVAIKVLLPDFAHDESARKRFEREAQAAAAVAHPNVVSIYQVGVLPQSQSSYFVMQFIEGETLAEVFPPGKPVPAPQARRVLGEVATALAAAHAKGLVHRDIKPANIMIERETGRTVVLDFGISAVLQSRQRPDEPKLTATGSSIGTPTYMSPEQASADELTPATDVYSLGCVAFELLTGRPPFIEQSAWALMAAHIKEAPPSVNDLVPGSDPLLGGLIDRALKKSPTERPAAADVARALLPGREAAIEWPPPGLQDLRSTLCRLGQLSLAVALGVVLFMGVLAVQPAAAGPSWATFDTGFWEDVRLVLGVPRDPVGPWSLVLGLAGVGLVMLAAFSLLRAAVLSLRVAQGRRLGYSLDLLIDVACDNDPRLETFINGVGWYAGRSGADVARYFRARRWQAVSHLLAAPLTAIALVAWLEGLLGQHVGKLQTAVLISDVLTVAAAPVACVLVALAIDSQMRAFAVAGRRRKRWRDILGITVRKDVVENWAGLAAKIREPRRSVSRHLPFPSLLPSLLSLVTLLVLAAPIVLTTQIVMFTAHEVDTHKQDASRWLASMKNDSLRTYRWPQVWAELRSHGSPVTSSAPDSGAATALLTYAYVASGGRGLDSVLKLDAAVMHSLSADNPFGSERWSRLSDFLTGTSASSIPDAEFAAAASRLGGAVSRRVSSSAPLPYFWEYRPRHTQPFVLVRAQWVDWTALERGGEAEVVLALERGDRQEALKRVREGLALAAALFRDADPLTRAEGEAIARQWTSILREVGRRLNDTLLTNEAEKLEALESVNQEHFRCSALSRWALWADADNPAGLTVARDTLNHPQVRLIGMMAGAVLGFCYNPREILFGVSERRIDLLSRLSAATGDIAGREPWIRGAQEAVRLLSEDPARAAGDWLDLPQYPGGWPRFLRFPGLDRLAARWGLCDEFWRRSAH